MRFYGLFFFVFVACNTSDHIDKTPGTSTGGASSVSSTIVPVCETGRQYLCQFSDGSYGVQFCKPDRSDYTDCIPLYDAIPLGGRTGTGGTTSAVTTSVVKQTGGRSASATTFYQTGGSSYVTPTTQGATGGYASVQATGGRQTGGTSVFISQTTTYHQTGGAGAAYTTIVSCTDADRDGECATTDCNDLDSRMRHGNQEICGNGLDDDCSGSSDCSDSVCSHLDACKEDQDHDGYSAGADCNDLDDRINPGRPEICSNGLDDNCDGFDCANANCQCILE